MKLTVPTLTFWLNITCYLAGTTSSIVYINNKWEQNLVNQGYAEYHPKTKQFHLCTPDEIVVNTNDKTVIGEVPVGIGTASVYIKFLLSELKNSKQEVDILQQQLFEKETILEKIKKK